MWCHSRSQAYHFDFPCPVEFYLRASVGSSLAKHILVFLIISVMSTSERKSCTFLCLMFSLSALRCFISWVEKISEKEDSKLLFEFFPILCELLQRKNLFSPSAFRKFALRLCLYACSIEVMSTSTWNYVQPASYPGRPKARNLPLRFAAQPAIN